MDDGNIQAKGIQDMLHQATGLQGRAGMVRTQVGLPGNANLQNQRGDQTETNIKFHCNEKLKSMIKH